MVRQEDQGEAVVLPVGMEDGVRQIRLLHGFAHGPNPGAFGLGVTDFVKNGGDFLVSGDRAGAAELFF